MKTMKLLYHILVILYMVLCGITIYYNVSMHYNNALMMSILSLALTFTVPIAFTIMKIKPIYEIYIIGLIFIFISSLAGSGMRFYSIISYWDLIAHGFSGVLGALAAYLLYCRLKKVAKAQNDYAIVFLFVTAINISIAVLWELYEYALLYFFDYDAILHYKSGVHDAMQDIIICIIGGLFTTYFIYRSVCKNKNNFIARIASQIHHKK